MIRTSFILWRFNLILAVIVIVVLGLIWRIVDLAIFDQHFLKQQGDERVLRLVNIPAFRGMIVDRNSYPLAVSTTVYSLWTNPQEFALSNDDIAALCKQISMKPKELMALVNVYKKKNREFVYLQRGLSPAMVKKIKALGLPQLYLQQEYKRYYPEGEIAAHVVGFTNIDDQGQEGLELVYNAWLQGEPGKKWVIKDRLGRVISDVQKIREQKTGRDLMLSIDRRIQYLAFRELLAGVTQTHAVSGSVVVLDVKTGEVLAMVNVPSFNPNNRPLRISANLRNRALTDTFEPGSTIKAFTVTSALESKRFKPDSIVDTSPGWMVLDHHMVKDEKNNGRISLPQILQLSSNMGSAKIALALAPDQIWNLLHRVGFGEITGVQFPGEQSGSLSDHYPWGAFTQATLSFGYGLSVNVMQLARAYAVIANNGVKVPISLLKLDHAPQGERIFEADVARQMLLLLETVVSKGGGAKAYVPGYRVAGKTGTARKVGKDGYQKHYTSSFVGIAPVNDPRLVVAVVIHNPQGKKYLGGAVASPIFERIMEETLRVLAVPPGAA